MYHDRGLSSVDDIDQPPAALALALLLAGANRGEVRRDVRRRRRGCHPPDDPEWLIRSPILVAARDEEEAIGETVDVAAAVVSRRGGDRRRRRLARRDRRAAEAAGAVVLRLPRRGKGQALSAAERAAPPGALLLVDADLRGDLTPLLPSDKVSQGLRIAVFAEREGGGFGIAKGVARALIRLRCGLDAAEPLSGQRALSPRARAAVFPLAPGFGAETRMTIDAVNAGVAVEEVELSAAITARPAATRAASCTAARQLLDALLAAGPLRVNYRGARLPLVGWTVALHEPLITAIGLADDRWSGEERGFREHLRARGRQACSSSSASPSSRWFARVRSPARCSSRCRRTRSTSSTRGPAAP